MTFPENIIFRKIEKTDFDKNYVHLLQYLSIVNPAEINMSQFTTFIENLGNNHAIYVLEDIDNNIIIGTITLLIEAKIIHNMGKVAHIEDVVVDPNYRDQHLGKLLVKHVTDIAHDANCYKIILDCGEQNEIFYTKCEFQRKGLQMARYF
jgi:glucosamine-phosphate N-acetyltransferase